MGSSQNYTWNKYFHQSVTGRTSQHRGCMPKNLTNAYRTVMLQHWNLLSLFLCSFLKLFRRMPPKRGEKVVLAPCMSIINLLTPWQSSLLIVKERIFLISSQDRRWPLSIIPSSWSLLPEHPHQQNCLSEQTAGGKGLNDW